MSGDKYDTRTNAYLSITPETQKKMKDRILHVIKPGGNYTYNEISEATGLGVNRITGRVHDLMKDELVAEGPKRRCTCNLPYCKDLIAKTWMRRIL